jgi:hypothetical protein
MLVMVPIDYAPVAVNECTRPAGDTAHRHSFVPQQLKWNVQEAITTSPIVISQQFQS